MPTAVLSDLEKRVQSLENRLWVAVVVAAIFGISGAFGYSMLRSAQKQLAALQDGIGTVQRARDAAVQDITAAKVSELAEFKAEAGPIAKAAAAGEMQDEIGKVKHWTAFVYGKAAETGLPNGQGANGWWQKSLIDQNALVQKDLQ